MFTDMIVAVGNPSECQTAKSAGFRTMSPSWHADDGIVMGKQGSKRIPIGRGEGEIQKKAAGKTPATLFEILFATA